MPGEKDYSASGMRQRARILGFLALAVLPLAALDGLRIGQNYDEDRQAARDAALRAVQSAALSLQVFQENQVTALQALALHPELARGRDTPALAEYLQRVIKERPNWVGLGVIGADGTTLVGTAGGPRVYLGDRPYFRAAVESGQPAISSGIVGRITGRTNVVIAAPFALQGGGRGVLIAPLPVAAFARELLPIVGARGLRFAVLDGDGQLIAHSEPERVQGLVPMREAPGVGPALRGEAGTLIETLEGADTLVAYAPAGKYRWSLVATQPASSAFSAARRELAERVAVLLAMVALVGALGWILSGRLARAYEREVAARGALERALRTREDFLAAASHDLRNPLAAARSANDLLGLALRRGMLSGERLEGSVARIESACRHMAALIDSFLDVARLETGAPLDLVDADLDLVTLVREVVDEIRLMQPRHAIELTAPSRLVVRADADRLRRAVANLAGNAVKYSPGGGRIAVQLERSSDGAWVVLSVTDEGIGIPAADLVRVFERFERGSNVVGRIPGTGIGLAGARQIVEQHGGTIEVQSRLGAGTTVTVRLPCTPDTAQAPQAETKQAA